MGHRRGRLAGYNWAVSDAEPTPDLPPRSRRHPGWATLAGTLGIALLTTGAMFLTTLEAPVVRRRMIVAACVLIAAGFVLLTVAWLGRGRSS